MQCILVTETEIIDPNVRLARDNKLQVLSRFGTSRHLPHLSNRFVTAHRRQRVLRSLREDGRPGSRIPPNTATKSATPSLASNERLKPSSVEKPRTIDLCTPSLGRNRDQPPRFSLRHEKSGLRHSRRHSAIDQTSTNLYQKRLSSWFAS